MSKHKMLIIRELFVCFLTEWCMDYESSRPKLEDLQREIDTFMQAHDLKVERVRRVFEGICYSNGNPYTPCGTFERCLTQGEYVFKGALDKYNIYLFYI